MLLLGYKAPLVQDNTEKLAYSRELIHYPSCWTRYIRSLHAVMPLAKLIPSKARLKHLGHVWVSQKRTSQARLLQRTASMMQPTRFPISIVCWEHVQEVNGRGHVHIGVPFTPWEFEQMRCIRPTSSSMRFCVSYLVALCIVSVAQVIGAS